MMARVYSLGIDEIDRKLEALAQREAAKVVRSAVGVGLTMLSKAARDNVDNEPDWSTRLRKKIKTTIGKKFKYGKNEQQGTAKTGFGVGKKQSKDGGKNRSKGGGVGLSPENAHWFALGTLQRWAGMKHIWRKRKGQAGEFVGRRLTGKRVGYRGRLKKASTPVTRAQSAGPEVAKAIELQARTKLEELATALK